MTRGTHHDQTLHFARQLAHPIDRVWHVLTDEDEGRYWFPARIVGPRQAGAAVRFVFGPKPPGVHDDDLAALIAERQRGLARAPAEVFAGVITAWQPPTLFELRWADQLLRFELTAHGAGTLLTFTCAFGQAEVADILPGWHVSLDWLDARCGGGGVPTTLAAFHALEASYRAQP